MKTELDARIEDVARTLHYVESLEPEKYWNSDFQFTWERENWYAIKALRNRARDLIEKFDKRERSDD